jgi:hypothetical protein
MAKWVALTLILSVVAPYPAMAGAGTRILPQVETAAEATAETATRGIGQRLLFYLPNRVFDVLDIVRLRVRIGPGIAAGARATRPISAFAGAYTSMYVGLRGPRGEAQIPWPIGADNRAGLQISTADISSGAPYYGPLEVGAGFQAIIFGLDIGVAAWEAVDLAAGLILLDPQGDDY